MGDGLNRINFIKRNPGTSWLIFCIAFSFILGVFMGIFGWSELVWRCWMLIAMWYIVTFHARWVDNRMESYFAKRAQKGQNTPI